MGWAISGLHGLGPADLAGQVRRALALTGSSAVPARRAYSRPEIARHATQPGSLPSSSRIAGSRNLTSLAPDRASSSASRPPITRSFGESAVSGFGIGNFAGFRDVISLLRPYRGVPEGRSAASGDSRNFRVRGFKWVVATLLASTKTEGS